MADEPSRLSSVLKRFRDTKDRLFNSPAKKQNVGPQAEKEAAVPEQPLQPLPQPAFQREQRKTAELAWISEPNYVDATTTGSFESLGVSSQLCERLNELGFGSAFAIQAAVIPGILADHARRQLSPDPMPDVLVHSFTGSGKTLAYCIPIVEALRSRVVARPRALVLLPTRPLMLQVQQTLEALAKGSKLRIMTLRADRALGKERQLIADTPPDIIISAPGRLVEHVRLNYQLLKDLEFVVADEADRLVSQSFQDWTSVLADAVPAPDRPSANGGPQRLVFSATLTRDPGKLRALQIRTAPYPPRLYVVASEQTEKEFVLPQGLSEQLIRVPSTRTKPLILVQQLVAANLLGEKTLVFVHSNEATVRLARLFEHVSSRVFGLSNVKVGACSGEMSAQDRRRALRQFADGELSVLVCTDMVARGIDVAGVSLVVNYDLPLGTREYVHRVGRTARAGSEGLAWTLACSSAERKHFWSLQNGISRPAKLEVVEATVDDAHTEGYEQALKALEEDVFSGH